MCLVKLLVSHDVHYGSVVFANYRLFVGESMVYLGQSIEASIMLIIFKG